MARSPRAHYLRVVDAQAPAATLGGGLLGLVDMSRASDVAIETILARLRPAWVFDLRPVPYFEIGRLTRRRAFELFRAHRASYRDVAGALQITDGRDASLNSGAIGAFVGQTLAAQPTPGPIVLLVDDAEVLAHAMHVLPRTLGASDPAAWAPLALDIEVRDGAPGLLGRAADGAVQALDAR